MNLVCVCVCVCGMVYISLFYFFRDRIHRYRVYHYSISNGLAQEKYQTSIVQSILIKWCQPNSLTYDSSIMKRLSIEYNYELL